MKRGLRSETEDPLGQPAQGQTGTGSESAAPAVAKA